MSATTFYFIPIIPKSPIILQINMKRTILTFIATISMALVAFAVDIPAGTFYFDNSKTKYDHVKFVYGNNSPAETFIVSMTHIDGSDHWSITFPEKVTNIYRYTFACTSLPDGKDDRSFNTVKDYISLTLNELRTATRSDYIPEGGIFVPDSGDNWAQGSWQTPSNPVDPSKPYSGTLPVMFINTEGGTAITSTEAYVSATCYIDNLGLDGYKSMGSADAPVVLQIKGRGNYTWTGFNKKPYRLKFAEKQSPLGMIKNKHFNLIAHADDDLAFLRNTVGFQLSRLLKLPYTPEQQPVEVVLNGDYIGLYFMTDKIRVDKNRVNIVEQPDEATDPLIVTGGWLIEIDNYDEAGQVKINEGNGSQIRFTPHTPETLSDVQRNYLTQQMTAANSAIYVSDKSSTLWESIIDMESLARFYIIQEVVDNAESFHGSCYLYKDQGYDTLWKFGPVWDFGNSFHRGFDRFIYVDPPYGQTWIGEIAKFNRFQAKVVEIWRPFFGTDYPSLDSFIDEFANQIRQAAIADANRWPSYGNRDVSGRTAEFKRRIAAKTNYLRQKWGEGINSAELVDADSTDPFIGRFSPTGDNRVFDISGRHITTLHNGESITTLRASGRLASGIYILRSHKFAL